MKRLLILFVFAALTAPAQQTRHTVTHHSANPTDDTRANNPAVPDVQALSSQVHRVVLLRFKYDIDLLAGLQQAVRDQKIRNAVILSGMGSVRGYQVHQVGNRDLPPEDIFTQNPTAPADIIGMSGLVLNGRVHPHIVLANPDHAFGGHLEPGTRVFTFAIVTLGILDDSLDLTRFDDWNNR